MNELKRKLLLDLSYELSDRFSPVDEILAKAEVVLNKYLAIYSQRVREEIIGKDVYMKNWPEMDGAENDLRAEQRQKLDDLNKEMGIKEDA